jgi:hypothetical protein
MWTAFMGLSWAAKLGGLTAIPVIGPLLSIIGGLAQLIWMFIKRVFAGVGKIVSDNEAAVALLTFMVIAGWLGIRFGIKYDAHLVKAANAELTSITTQLEALHRVEDIKKKAAIEAREKAKAAPFEVVTTVPPAAAAAVAPSVRPKSRRKESPCSDLERMLNIRSCPP